MPRTTSPDSYPARYHRIVQECGLEGKVIRLPREGPFPSDQELSGLQRLLKLRGHFYAFIGALKRSKDERWKEMAVWASQTTVHLDRKEVCITFSNRDKSWQSQAFELAGEVGASAAEGEPVPDAIAASMRRVLDGIEKDLEKEQK